MEAEIRQVMRPWGALTVSIFEDLFVPLLREQFFFHGGVPGSTLMENPGWFPWALISKTEGGQGD